MSESENQAAAKPSELSDLLGQRIKAAEEEWKNVVLTVDEAKKALAEIERLRALLRGECEAEYEPLEDAECLTFRMMPGSFNDMVRAIHKHGWDGALLFMPPNAELTCP